MQSYYADKKQENTSMAVANRISKPSNRGVCDVSFVDNRPETIAQRKLQHMLNTSLQVRQLTAFGGIADSNSKEGLHHKYLNTAAPLQRYQSIDSEKLSQNGLLLLENPSSLYAGPTQFGQGNAIDNDVEFKKGENKVVGDKQLKKVIPVIKEGSELKAHLNDFDEESEAKSITEGAKKKYYPSVDQLEEQLKEKVRPVRARALKGSEKDQALLGTTNADELRTIIAGLAEVGSIFLQHFGNFSESEVAAKLKSYLQAQSALRDRPLMPSDCRAMAYYIAGFDAGHRWMETEEFAPGNVYEYAATRRDISEWDFHYATIIMTDGSDHVTMENAAAKASDKFSKMRYDHSWFFEMYGTSLDYSCDFYYEHLYHSFSRS